MKSIHSEYHGGIKFVEAAGPIELPEDYAIVLAVACPVSNLNVPERTPVSRNTAHTYDDVLQGEKQWLQEALSLLQEGRKSDGKSPPTWASHHASKQRCVTNKLPGIGALLPLFIDKSPTISMIKHGTDIVKRITEYLNHGQVPVIACDQPLFALVNYVQWAWPDTYGDNKLIAMLESLHTEMSYWKLVGALLDQSGWSVMMTESEVDTAG